ncbi:MAG: M48 family metallopeptidase [Pseudomonadota bacterium]
MAVDADYFDGQSARAYPVTLALVGRQLEMCGEGVHRVFDLGELRLSEPMGAAPRLVKFPDGAHCEVRDHQGFAELLAQSGHQDGWVVRMQGHWRWALVAVLVSVLAVAAGYRWGLPAVSEWLAFRLPEKALAKLGKETLEIFDQTLLAPSKLPLPRSQALAEAFDALDVPGGDRPGYRILFRDSPRVGANAFALPDGTIVMTDQLVDLADNDEEILAVLAHELGHVQQRHSLRMLIQGSIVAFVVAAYVGDVGSVAAGLPTLLLEAGYSRDHEREADAYAAALLQHNGLSPARLATLLAKLEAAHGDGEAGALDYFSSHPGGQERIKALSGVVPGR